jgi:hypothetical protein
MKGCNVLMSCACCCSLQVELSVVDNVLVIHYPSASVVMLVDVALDAGQAQLVDPLPLRRLQLLPAAVVSTCTTPAQTSPRPAAAAGGDEDEGMELKSLGGSCNTAAAASDRSAGADAAAEQQGEGMGAEITASGGASSNNATTSSSSSLVYVASDCHHSPSWRYHHPNIIVDADGGTVGRLLLDLKAVTESAGDWPALVGFLMRRRAPLAVVPLAAEPHELMLGVCRAALQERPGMAVLRAMFKHLVQVSGVREVEGMMVTAEITKTMYIIDSFWCFLGTK